ncbi:unnamed protein product [Calicophoron daubneyi]|uniref:Uncharacterized protein n=1 Tax=Calicophoron daubneyi TaxID=300641 RepID=A0AAV2TLT6_CALDB
MRSMKIETILMVSIVPYLCECVSSMKLDISFVLMHVYICVRAQSVIHTLGCFVLPSTYGSFIPVDFVQTVVFFLFKHIRFFALLTFEILRRSFGDFDFWASVLQSLLPLCIHV